MKRWTEWMERGALGRLALICALLTSTAWSQAACACAPGHSRCASGGSHEAECACCGQHDAAPAEQPRSCCAKAPEPAPAKRSCCAHETAPAAAPGAPSLHKPACVCAFSTNDRPVFPGRDLNPFQAPATPDVQPLLAVVAPPLPVLAALPCVGPQHHAPPGSARVSALLCTFRC